jgi:hypothetical protein
MTRAQLEHIIRAAGAVTDARDLVAIGSQAVLGQFPNAPAEFLVSHKADIFPRGAPGSSDLIDGSIGEDSPFHRTFGYYARGVDETTAILPEGWRDRLVLLETENTLHIRGWCLEVHDLAIAKYAAGREKDLDFTNALVRHVMVERQVLEQRLTATPLDDGIRNLITARMQRDFAGE